MVNTSLTDITISAHALKRFTERFENVYGIIPLSPVQSLKEVLEKASPEKMLPHLRVKRIMSNGYQLAEYYTYQGWRFVVTDNTLLTVERIEKGQNKCLTG